MLFKMGLSERAESARNDPEIGSHVENVVLLESLILEAGDKRILPYEYWKQASDLYAKAVGSGDADALNQLGLLLRDATAEAAREQRQLNLVDRQRKHRDSEVRRELAIGAVVTARELELVFATLQKVLADQRGKVLDDAVFRQIGAELRPLLQRAPC